MPPLGATDLLLLLLDGQLARITRPDGQQINLTYDPETGQLLAQTPTGQTFHRYNGQDPDGIDAPGEALAYTRRSLPTVRAGQRGCRRRRAYDNNLRDHAA
jgi:YD repeat-containing protein